MIINCKFLDENGIAKGRAYTYESDESLVVGQIVETETGKSVVVTDIDVATDYTGELKKVSSTQLNEISLPEISITSENIAIVEQWPIITEQLDLVSVQVDKIIDAVLSLEHNESSRKQVKTARAKLNSLFSMFEEKRKYIATEVNKPYDIFNQKYKVCVADKIKSALLQIDSRTNEIESGIKSIMENDIKAYFAEYATSMHLEWITWEKANIKVGLSDNKTALMRKATTFLDQIAQDMQVIETQEHKSEIEVEYKKNFNLAIAIATVKRRKDEIQLAEKRRLELEQMKAQAQHRAEEMKQATPAPQPAIQQPVIQQPIVTPQPAIQPQPEPQIRRTGTVCFTVTGTVEEIQSLKKFIVENNIQYEQIPLKNIIREQN